MCYVRLWLVLIFSSIGFTFTFKCGIPLTRTNNARLVVQCNLNHQDPTKPRQTHPQNPAPRKPGGRINPTDAGPNTLWKLLPPHIISQYEIVKELGRGGHGCVVLAQEKNSKEVKNGLPKRVAIKLCRPQPGEIPVLLKEGTFLFCEHDE